MVTNHGWLDKEEGFGGRARDREKTRGGVRSRVGLRDAPMGRDQMGRGHRGEEHREQPEQRQTGACEQGRACHNG